MTYPRTVCALILIAILVMSPLSRGLEDALALGLVVAAPGILVASIQRAVLGKQRSWRYLGAGLMPAFFAFLIYFGHLYFGHYHRQ
jgi:hypothetical protein